MNYLTKLKDLASRATNCKWESKIWCGAEDNVWVAVGPVHKQEDDDLDPSSIAAQIAERDAAFIAASREAVPKLVEAIEEMQKALEWYTNDGLYRWDLVGDFDMMCGVLSDGGDKAKSALSKCAAILDGGEK